MNEYTKSIQVHDSGQPTVLRKKILTAQNKIVNAFGTENKMARSTKNGGNSLFKYLDWFF